ncbi:MAG: aldose 1-epimerase [Acidimicrobiia bacterium]
MAAGIEQHTFRGEPAITLRAGDLAATFVPDVGMTGVSLRYRGREHLALPGGLDALRAGHTAGLPLLAPWANRLASRRYRAAGVAVNLSGLRLGTDNNGLPIHGLLVGKAGWRVDGQAVRGATAQLRASIDVDARAFPFPHRIELSIAARDGLLRVDTTLIPTGRRRVPVAFGWHPYLKLPGTARGRWRLRLPRRERLLLDERGIPTVATEAAQREAAPIATRTYDDLYALGRGHDLAFEGDDGAAIELRCGIGYPYAQVWVPKGRPFGALEPMTAPTNSLEHNDTPLIAPGDAFTARFELAITAPGSNA